MARVRQRGTKPELRIRALLTRLGIRYRLNASSLPGTPDIVNRRARKAIFVHGCFWHRHAGCRKATTPKRNKTFWLQKFRANEARDKRKFDELHALGFGVLVIWECELESPTDLGDRLKLFWNL